MSLVVNSFQHFLPPFTHPVRRKNTALVMVENTKGSGLFYDELHHAAQDNHKFLARTWKLAKWTGKPQVSNFGVIRQGVFVDKRGRASLAGAWARPGAALSKQTNSHAHTPAAQPVLPSLLSILEALLKACLGMINVYGLTYRLAA